VLNHSEHENDEGNGGKEREREEGESESTIKFILLKAFEAEGVKTGEGSGIFDSLVAKGTFHQLGN